MDEDRRARLMLATMTALTTILLAAGTALAKPNEVCLYPFGC